MQHKSTENALIFSVAYLAQEQLTAVIIMQQDICSVHSSSSLIIHSLRQRKVNVRR